VICLLLSAGRKLLPPLNVTQVAPSDLNDTLRSFRGKNAVVWSGTVDLAGFTYDTVDGDTIVANEAVSTTGPTECHFTVDSQRYVTVDSQRYVLSGKDTMIDCQHSKYPAYEGGCSNTSDYCNVEQSNFLDRKGVTKNMPCQHNSKVGPGMNVATL